MNKTYFNLIILSIFSLTNVFSQNNSNENKITLAVLEFAGYGISHNESLILTSRFSSDLVNTNRFNVLDRKNLNEILKEQGFQNSGCTTSECAVEAGKLLNVQKVISGEIGKIGDTFSIVIFLLDVELGKVEKSISREYKGKIEKLLGYLHTIAESISEDDGNNKSYFDLNPEKIILKEKSFENMDSLQYEQKEKISGSKAVLYSAVLPGAGQYYAESYWRAALYATVEIAAWTVFFINDSKGDDKDKEMKAYGDRHWSEQTYWSKVYYHAKIKKDNGNSEFANLPDYTVTNNILDVYNAEVINTLRNYENKLEGYSHSLPHTHTQQYYEMIYKYPGQFAHGWSDANPDFEFSYHEDGSNLPSTALNFRDLRNLSDEYFDIASGATMAVLVNHVLSALDAALAARSYNRNLHLEFTINHKNLPYERVKMYGLQLAW